MDRRVLRSEIEQYADLTNINGVTPNFHLNEFLRGFSVTSSRFSGGSGGWRAGVGGGVNDNYQHNHSDWYPWLHPYYYQRLYQDRSRVLVCMNG